MAQTTSPDNIVYPTLNDQGDDVPAVMATMAGSIQTALTNLRNSLNTSINSIVTIGSLTGLNSVTMQAGTGVAKVGRLVTMSLSANRTAGFPVLDVATIPAAYRPQASLTVGGMASLGGGAAPVTVVIGTDGNVKNWTNASGNTRLDVQASWIVAA